MITFKNPEMNERIQLIRTDKNGTKYYVDSRCPKCGGTGYGPWFQDGGVCYKCGGTGVSPHKFMVRTPEYQAKLDQRRFDKRKAAAAKMNEKWLADNGFAYGLTYVYLGNTWDIKDELKAEGAKFNYNIGWHSAMKINEFSAHEFLAEELVQKDDAGMIIGWSVEGQEMVERVKKAYEAESAPKSEYVGEIGKRQEFTLTLLDAICIDGYYGPSYINKLADADGNIFIWKTGRQITERGGIVRLRGTVKDHSEYRFVKQTILSRCKEV